MSVRAIWKIKRIQSLKLAPEHKRCLVEAVVSKKPGIITLWAWRTDSGEPHVFFTAAKAIRSWVETHGLKALGTIGRIPLFSWSADIRDVLSFIVDGEVKDMPIAKETTIEYVDLSLFDDITRSLTQIKP